MFCRTTGFMDFSVYEVDVTGRKRNYRIITTAMSSSIMISKDIYVGSVHNFCFSWQRRQSFEGLSRSSNCKNRSK